MRQGWGIRMKPASTVVYLYHFLSAAVTDRLAVLHMAEGAFARMVIGEPQVFEVGHINKYTFAAGESQVATENLGSST